MSLQRPKTVMGTDPMAFYGVAFLASFFFASKVYLAMPLLIPVHLIGRMLTKKDPKFMTIFLRYLDEPSAFSSIPRPTDWMKRPAGWGRGLPW